MYANYDDLLTYHRNYQRRLHGHKPRKEINEIKFAKFRGAVLTTSYSIKNLSEELEIHITTGYHWLKRIQKMTERPPHKLFCSCKICNYKFLSGDFIAFRLHEPICRKCYDNGNILVKGH